MAPCSYGTDSSSEIRTSPKVKTRPRKPVVEKMRRDRINSSIEQLRQLLEDEFRQHQPGARLEKADVLEMTVSFLKRRLQPQKAHTEGFAQCWRETLRFLSTSSQGTSPLHQLLRFHGDQSIAGGLPAALQAGARPVKQESDAQQPIWRPW